MSNYSNLDRKQLLNLQNRLKEEIRHLLNDPNPFTKIRVPRRQNDIMALEKEIRKREDLQYQLLTLVNISDNYFNSKQLT